VAVDLTTGIDLLLSGLETTAPDKNRRCGGGWPMMMALSPAPPLQRLLADVPGSDRRSSFTPRLKVFSYSAMHRRA
jgi:hypothetical protein